MSIVAKALRQLLLSATATLLVGVVSANAIPLTAGDLAVFQTGPLVPNGPLSSSGGTPINIIEISSTTAGQTSPIQTIGTPLFISGTASSTGILRNNAGLLVFAGHTVAAAAAVNQNTVTSRAVGTIDPSGTYNSATTYTGISGNQPRSAMTANGTDFYIGDQGGIYGNGNTSPEFAGNLRSVGLFGGVTYALQASGTATNIVVSSLSPVGPQNAGPVTLTGLPGLTNNANAQDFFMLASGSQGSLPDTLYVTTTTGLSKFSFDGTTWTARGTAVVASGAYGIAAKADAVSGVDLFLTTGNGTGTNVVSALDSAAFNSNITLSTPTTLYTVPGAVTATLRGLAIVPTPEPASLCLVTVGAAGLLARRRRS